MLRSTFLGNGSLAKGILGQRIRAERLKKNLTLEQLSDKAKLSISFLSQIERDLAQPSITSLKKIGHVLGISVVNFFMNEKIQDNSFGELPSYAENGRNEMAYVKDIQVVRVDRRKRLSLPGSNVVYELLTPDLNRRLEVMHMKIDPTDNSGDEPMIDPPGEKFGVVLKGTIECRVGDEVYKLQEGDSIYFPANLPHSWKGMGEHPIEVIWVLTPPWF